MFNINESLRRAEQRLGRTSRRRQRSDAGRSRLSAPILAELESAALGQERPSMSALQQRIAERCAESGVKPPARAASTMRLSASRAIPTRSRTCRPTWPGPSTISRQWATFRVTNSRSTASITARCRPSATPPGRPGRPARSAAPPGLAPAQRRLARGGHARYGGFDGRHPQQYFAGPFPAAAHPRPGGIAPPPPVAGYVHRGPRPYRRSQPYRPSPGHVPTFSASEKGSPTSTTSSVQLEPAGRGGAIPRQTKHSRHRPTGCARSRTSTTPTVRRHCPEEAARTGARSRISS